MSPLPPPQEHAASNGSGPQNSPQTPTPFVRVEVSSEGPVILSPLSRSLFDNPTENGERENQADTKKPVGQETTGGAQPWMALGAKVHPRMYADAERLAAYHDIGLSDIVRGGVRLYLQAHGIDQGLNIDAEALDAAQARLAEHEAKAASQRPKVPLTVAAKRTAVPEYRGEKMQEAARLHPEELAIAVRLWRQEHTRHLVQDAATVEAVTPVKLQHLSGNSPVLRVLRPVFGSYANLRDALIDETGVKS